MRLLQNARFVTHGVDAVGLCFATKILRGVAGRPPRDPILAAGLGPRTRDTGPAQGIQPSALTPSCRGRRARAGGCRALSGGAPERLGPAHPARASCLGTELGTLPYQ